jgi:SAM-dependent methyltransferase
MRNPHAVWHYGLMAEYWALFKQETPELPELISLIHRFGQPVLDLGCGTGRVLMALLDVGMDADGIDVSEDMMAHARTAAHLKAHAPALSVQPMSGFVTDRSCRAIVIVDSFGLGGDRDHDLATLRRCRAALQPGGALVLNVQMEYASADAWLQWSKDGRERLPEPWPDRAVERMAPNEDAYRLRIRTLAVSPLRQSYTREMHIEKWIEGRMAAQEVATLTGNMYLPSEVVSLLRQAGQPDPPRARSGAPFTSRSPRCGSRLPRACCRVRPLHAPGQSQPYPRHRRTCNLRQRLPVPFRLNLHGSFRVPRYQSRYWGSSFVLARTACQRPGTVQLER